MMTGDNYKTARTIAAKVGIDEFYAEVLPEDKAGYVEEMQRQGHRVIMVGDGINDSPALSAADVGVAVSSGAQIAREIADVTISSNRLYELVCLKQLSTALMQRIHRSYKVYYRLQYIADRPWADRHDAAGDIGHVPQFVHTADWP